VALKRSRVQKVGVKEKEMISKVAIGTIGMKFCRNFVATC
jgi:hypothetical protein